MAGKSGTFVQLYDSLATGGLLARLSGSAVKVLLAIGSAAVPLGSGTAAARRFARDLMARGAVTPADGGRLFCHLPHHELARRAGLGKNTVTRATAQLHALGLIEKRPIPNPDGSHYNLFFLEPASHIDKFNAHHSPIPNPQCPISNPHSPLPKTGTVPKTGTKYIQKNQDPPPPPSRRQVDNNLNPLALLAHFAERQGLARYRPTAHDRRKLDRLRRGGYSQAQVLAAIDRAFDRRPADAPPIRMFSFCATIALAGPPQGPPPAPDGAPISNPQSPISNPQSPIPSPPLPTALTDLYAAEIAPLTPLARRELERLFARHPDLEDWQYAFREAVANGARALRYVQRVLEGCAERRAAGLDPYRAARGRGPRNHTAQGGKRGENGQNRRPTAGDRRPGDRRGPGEQRGAQRARPLPPDTGRAFDPGCVFDPGRIFDAGRVFDPAAVAEGRQSFNWRTATEQQLRAVQRACADVEVLDYRHVLGLSPRPGAEYA